jgi:uncharacterized RDD family membrane protein YckC
MKFTRSRVSLACLVLALTHSAWLSAESSAPQSRATARTAVDVQADRTPVEQEDRPRFRRPIIRGLQNYTLGAGDTVPEVRTVFGDVTIEGRVEGDVVVILGSVRLASTGSIGRSLVVIGGGAKVEGAGRVGEDLVVIGGTLDAPPTFSPDGDHVVIGTPWFGDIIRDLRPWLTRGLLWGRLIVPNVEWIWLVVGTFLLLYLALNSVFDGPVAATANVINERPVSAFFSGLLVLILSIPVLAILAATLIGLVVVPFLLCGIVVAALLGKTAVIRAIGRGLIRPEMPEGRLAALGAFLVGFAVLVFAYMVPLLGFVTWAIVTVIGLGAATATLRGHLRRERKRDAPVSEAPAALTPIAVASTVTPVEPPVASYIPPPVAAEPVLPPPSPLPPPPLPPRPVFDRGLAQYPRATFLDRLAAFVLDCILVAIATALLDLNRHDGSFFFLLLCYHIGFWAWKGTTLGGIICNLRVIRTDGTDPRFVDAVVRGLSGIFSIAALGIGCLWMLQDPERQMWHDKIAGTLVVKAPREVVLA